MQRIKRCSCDKLLFFSEENGIRYTILSELLGIEYQHLWRIVTSRNRPGWSLLIRIMRLTNGEVTPNDFARPLLSESGDLDRIEQEKPLRSAAA